MSAHLASLLNVLGQVTFPANIFSNVSSLVLPANGELLKHTEESKNRRPIDSICYPVTFDTFQLQSSQSQLIL